METADKRGIAESESSRPSTLMIDIPVDQVQDLPCVQQASYPEGGPLVWMLPLYLHVNQKSYYDMIFIYQIKIRLDISCELSARQKIHMKCQLSLKMIKKNKSTAYAPPLHLHQASAITLSKIKSQGKCIKLSLNKVEHEYMTEMTFFKVP